MNKERFHTLAVLLALTMNNLEKKKFLFAGGEFKRSRTSADSQNDQTHRRFNASNIKLKRHFECGYISCEKSIFYNN